MVPADTGPSARPRTVVVALASLSLFALGGYLGVDRAGEASVSASLVARSAAAPANSFGNDEHVASPLAPAPAAITAEALELNRLRLELAAELVGRAVSLPSGYPVECPLSSKWGMRRHPKRKKVLPHHGVDLGCPVGTVVRATADGTVLGAGESTRSGQWIRVVHAEGYGTVFAHLDTVLVRKGQRVAIGDTLALSGESGDVTGPHLHYEVNWGGRRSDSLSLPINALASVRDSLLAEAESLYGTVRRAHAPGEAPKR